MHMLTRSDQEAMLAGRGLLTGRPVEEVTLRGVSPVIATAGPYAGAIVRGAELRLCLDAHALAEMPTGAP